MGVMEEEFSAGDAAVPKAWWGGAGGRPQKAQFRPFFAGMRARRALVGRFCPVLGLRAGRG